VRKGLPQGEVADLISNMLGSDLSERLVIDSDTSAERATAAAKRKLLIGAALCLLFMCAEIVGGYLAHSLAIMTDAAHMLSDVAGFLVGVLSLFLTNRAPTPKYSFGYHIAEVLGAMVSISIVWLMTGVLLYEATNRLFSPEPVDGRTMFVVSLVGVVMNVVLMAVLGHGEGGHGGHGGHGHSHGGGGHGGGGHGGGHGGGLAPVRAVADGHDHSHAPAAGHGHGHGHAEEGEGGEAGHGPCCGEGEGAGGAGSSLALRAAMLHVTGDACRSLL